MVKQSDDCDIKHAPLEVQIENLKENVKRVEDAVGKTTEEMWSAINQLRTTASNLERSVGQINARLAIFVGVGGFAVQALAKYVFK